MAEVQKSRGRPKKDRPKLAPAPQVFEKDEEFGLTEMQAAFVWHYTEGAVGQTEAARRAGFSFPSHASSKMLNGRDHPNVVRAIRSKQDELKERFAIRAEKTAKMLFEIAEKSFEAGHYNASVSAVKELNQMAGITVHRSQNLNINANIDNMSKDDIKKRLGALLGASEELSDKDR